jgi:hypothetical protein
MADAENVWALRIKEVRNLEDQIQEYEKSNFVRIAREYDAIREKRVAYLQELKALYKRGMKLAAEGWEVPNAED